MRQWARNISGDNSMILYGEAPLGHKETTCHLCLREVQLTYEHVPPKKAFNECRRIWERFNPRTRGVDEQGDLRGAPQTRFDVWQGGFYVRTLCEGCNNGTGGSSAKAYVRFVKALAEAPRLLDSSGGHRIVRVEGDTLMIARQIAVMILAVEDIKLARNHNDLRLFARGELDGLVPPFRVLAFLVPDRPEAGSIVRAHARMDTYAPGCGAMAGEISLFPFGFVYAWQLQSNYRPQELADITHWFSRTSMTERLNTWMTAPITVTVLDSMHCTLGNPRFGPQLDTLPEPGN